ARTSLRGGGGGGGCPRPPRRWGAWASQERSSTGTPIVAGRRSLTPPLARASRLSPSFILSWTPGRRAVPRRDARPAAVPYLRTLRHRTAPADGARATIVRGLRAPRIEDLGCWLRGFARPNDDLRAPCRACSPGASAQPFINNHFVMETATIKLAHDRIPKLAPDRPPKLNVVIT